MDVLLLIPAGLCAYECWHRYKKNPTISWSWMTGWGAAAAICVLAMVF